jgi:hypothetical protein
MKNALMVKQPPYLKTITRDQPPSQLVHGSALKKCNHWPHISLKTRMFSLGVHVTGEKCCLNGTTEMVPRCLIGHEYTMALNLFGTFTADE